MLIHNGLHAFRFCWYYSKRDLWRIHYMFTVFRFSYFYFKSFVHRNDEWFLINVAQQRDGFCNVRKVVSHISMQHMQTVFFSFKERVPVRYYKYARQDRFILRIQVQNCQAERIHINLTKIVFESYFKNNSARCVDFEIRRSQKSSNSSTPPYQLAQMARVRPHAISLSRLLTEELFSSTSTAWSWELGLCAPRTPRWYGLVRFRCGLKINSRNYLQKYVLYKYVSIQ